MLWGIIAGALLLGVGPIALRKEIDGLLTILGAVGFFLFVGALSFGLHLLDRTRCGLGNNRVCGEIRREAALDLWPTQATVSGWTVEQMNQYADRESWPHRWRMLRIESFSSETVTTEQRCVGYSFPTTLEQYRKSCDDRRIITPGPYDGRSLRTPFTNEPAPNHQQNDIDDAWLHATEPTIPAYLPFRSDS